MGKLKVSIGGKLIIGLVGLIVSSAKAEAANCPQSPAGVGQSSGTYSCTCSAPNVYAAVWGTNVYTNDSDLCKAALHSGKISAAGGVISYTLTNGQSAYQGSYVNGVSSNSYGSWGSSFILNKSLAPAPLACVFNGQSIASGQSVNAFQAAIVTSGSSCSSEVRTCNNGVLGGTNQYSSCTVALALTPAPTPTPTPIPPPSPSGQLAACPNSPASLGQTVGGATCVCGVVNTYAPVWGGGIYTNDSNLCTAARHAGRITSQGGVVRYQMMQGMPSYSGVLSNNISSASYGPWPSSFAFADVPMVAVQNILLMRLTYDNGSYVQAAICNINESTYVDLLNQYHLANRQTYGSGTQIVKATALILNQQNGIPYVAPMMCDQLQRSSAVVKDISDIWIGRGYQF